MTDKEEAPPAADADIAAEAGDGDHPSAEVESEGAAAAGAADTAAAAAPDGSEGEDAEMNDVDDGSEGDEEGEEADDDVEDEKVDDSDGDGDQDGDDDEGAKSKPDVDADSPVKKRKKEIDFELPSVPTKVKKARTAYFMFADEKRAEIVEANPGEAVGTIAKKIGELWSKLSPEEKEKYQSKAREEKGRVALETEALREAGLLIEDSAAGSGGAQGGFVLPVARVRKIVKLDPEVKGLSKEGIQLITKASELFVAALGTNSVQVATLQNRRKIVPDDILQVCETKPNFMFLQEDVRTLIDEQKEEHKSKEKAKEEAKSKANSEANSGVKPLTSFFVPSSVTSNNAE